MNMIVLCLRCCLAAARLVVDVWAERWPQSWLGRRAVAAREVLRLVAEVVRVCVKPAQVITEGREPLGAVAAGWTSALAVDVYCAVWPMLTIGMSVAWLWRRHTIRRLAAAIGELFGRGEEE